MIPWLSSIRQAAHNMAPRLSALLPPLFLFLVLHQAGEARDLKPSISKFAQVLQTLEGSIKGQTVQGLNQVKHYLQHYGYYPNDVHSLTDDFDESLESGLKLYQKNYHLKVTGQIDADTIKEITIPRCGNPDIEHHPTKHSHKPSKFHMVAHYSFFDGSPRWSKAQLTYSFVGVQVIPLNQLRQVCASAFSKWAQYSSFTFQEAPQGERGDITIGFFSGYHGDGRPFDGPGRVLAHSFRPEIGMFHYDADENWSTQPNMNQVDLESVAVHEIGHLLGLGHSMDANAIMYAEIPPGVIKRDLAQDDVDGIRALYSN